MSNKMLIDAAHPEETRVVVLRGNRVEDFDFESASKKPLRGNIYLAKVTRVEPSLQAAFIEYGGNRHGFLAFSEIHPDYYQIPVADRQALLDEEARANREEDDEPRNGSARRSRRNRRSGSSEKRAPRTGDTVSESVDEAEDGFGGDASPADPRDEAPPADFSGSDESDVPASSESGDEPPLPFVEDTPPEQPDLASDGEGEAAALYADIEAEPSFEPASEGRRDEGFETESLDAEEPKSDRRDTHDDTASGDEGEADEEVVEQLGGDAMEDVPYRAPRMRRHYKIQEVIKRRQILLVQVVKEERGNKGAALTTYLSLAGRYSVLMPNTARGGGISRKITDSDDRKRLKSIAHELEVPEGMGIILRTAGASRSESEVKRDFEYLLRMWETIRELTLRSSAPSLVYEEGSLIKRAIRDLFTREMDEVTVAGETAYREAREFMRLLMPSHAKFVRLYGDSQPIFAKSGVEAQLDAMFSNHVTLRSGGYIVINQTEALVAIDVNSGRSTREHNIEDTALRTNLEAADEVARQLRLRDLAGLIVVDFIDMEESRNNRAVERRMKDALKNDRARIQIGRISHFGLLEMSRQRIRTGVLEGSTILCPHCAGAGTVRSTSSIALHVLRILEDTLIRSGEFNLIVRTRMEVALYILNQKRAHLSDLEQRFGVTISVMADGALTGTVYHALERGEPATPAAVIAPRQPAATTEALLDEDEDEIENSVEDDEDIGVEEEAAPRVTQRQGEPRQPDGDDANGDRKRRRRRRRRGRDRDGRAPESVADGEMVGTETGFDAEVLDDSPEPAGGEMTTEAAPSLAPTDLDLEPTPSEPAAAEMTPEDASSGDDQPVEPIEAPRRRRTRRSATRSAALSEEAAPSVTESAAADPAPAPRRSRRTRVRPPEEETPSLLPFSPPSADRDVGAPIAKTEEDEPAPVGVFAPSPPVAPADELKAAAEPAKEAEPAAVEAPPAPAAAPEPDRPKRSGWWQRAKATLTGE